MSERPKDALLLSAKLLTWFVQGLCAVAGAAVVLLVPVVLLAAQGMLPGLGAAHRSETIAASPTAVVAILVLLAAILAALFLFFGKLRAIIASVGDDNAFTPDNATRLYAMAWLFLGVKILSVLVSGLRHHLLNLMDKDPGGANSLGLSLYDLDALVIVLVLLILARVFRHGAAMRQDLAATV